MSDTLNQTKSEWKEYKLGDVLTFQRGHDLPKTEMIEGSYPVAGSNGIIGFHNKYTTKGPGITIGRSGNIGTPHFYRNDFWAHNTVLYIKDFKGNSELFLFYFLKTLDFKQFNTGSAVPSLNRNHIHELFVEIPPLPEQSAIATVLSSLDDKIDLLHRQNQTLEALAETLFRQWFVEEAKEEWEEITLYDAIELVGGGTPKTTVNEYWDGNIKWLSGGDIAGNHKNFVVSSEKSITELGLKNSSAKLLPKLSTVISARGTVGKYSMLSEPMTFSQSNYGILPKFKDCFFFTYLLVAHSVDELQSAAYGSVFDTITTNTFKGLTITLPEEEYIIRFNESMEPYFSKILTNQSQIRTLTALRDTLLPKLMSGEIRVKMG
ncbi:MAG: restriction endonuclease subunit S [Saprospiraceae bacterium]|nr:MAG: type I restriction modification enzyme protein S [Candidatus Parvibacillus calidus]MCC7147705.1 restriction endonuclease subunit S [Saprospiraceae bacterium]WKZ62397.1 MAG: restriction endonuclease subunit S [Saprospiraceae bacterium]